MKTLNLKSILFSLLAILTLSVLMTMTSCEQQPTLTLLEEMQQYDLGVQEYSEQKIQGQTVIVGHTLTYEAIETDGHYELTIQLHDKKFDVEIGYSPNYYDINGNGVQLNNEEKYVLADFAGSLADAITNRSSNPADGVNFYLVERTLVTVISLLGETPQNYAIENKTYADETSTTTTEERSLNNDGITCVKRGVWYNISFDQQNNGYAHNLTKKVGNTPCKGRCGPGCNALIGGWKWTLDCFEHDWCVTVLGGSSLHNSPDCGDEFWNASDDYLFADWCLGL